MNRVAIALAAAWVAAASASGARGDPGHGNHAGTPAAKQQKPWGIAGEPGAVARTIEVSMLDRMRFAPDSIDVREGETVRLVVRNEGKLFHELVVGTKEDLDAHARSMAAAPGMAHDAPYIAHVLPGRTGQVIWMFNRPGRFEFACLVPGHYEAGMIGRIDVAPR